MLNHGRIESCTRRRNDGYALLEVLISIVILAIGLLGLAKLQGSTRQLEMESYQRAQAIIILQDMVNRLSANRGAALCYAVTDNAGAGYYGDNATAPLPASCPLGTATQQAQADRDLAEWNALLVGASETEGGAAVGAMIAGRGCIFRDPASGVYVVTVAWQGILKSAAPAGLNCGTGTYSAENQRRAVSAIVRFPVLL